MNQNVSVRVHVQLGNEFVVLGKLKKKNVGLHQGDPIQQIDYNYNIRGWLTGINDPGDTQNPLSNYLFRFYLSYDSVTNAPNSEVTSLYNGNISETKWSSKVDHHTLRKYSYEYDAMNRLSEGHYSKPALASNNENYNEALTYDRNGNILSIQRNGDLDAPLITNAIDDLIYTYKSNSNELLEVSDQTNDPSGFTDDLTGSVGVPNDYSYDQMGNMVKDENKNIDTITYNHLNLPTAILFHDGGHIKYLYNALGQKLRKTITSNNLPSVVNYLDGFQYIGDNLQFFPTAEGYVRCTKVGSVPHYNYVYQYKDHLGNIRMNFAVDPKSQQIKILEENHYYPFGLKHANYHSSRMEFREENAAVALKEDPNAALKYDYKFQGQERQDELGLNWDSFKWRNYDYAIGRFMNIDPLAEKYAYQSPYNFSENRVIDGRELEGLEWQNFRTTGKNPGSLTQKVPSANAQQQHYSVTVADSKKSFSEFKSDFKEQPQDFLTNSKATFNAPVNGDGEPSNFEKGSFIKIDIDGPMNNGYVKVVGMEDKKDKLTTTFGTMEGHMEKGKITFRLIENKDGSITFSIDSKSEVDMGIAPESFSRSQQQKSWGEVLNNVSRYLDGDVTKKESKVVEPIK